MAEAESEEAVRLRSKASEMSQSPSSITLPASKKPKSSYILTKSVTDTVDDDPIRLRNQSCIVREEIGKTVNGERLVCSSLAHLPTFSIGLSSTQGESRLPAPLRESNVGPEDKSPHRYFQMPELGARVFIGNGDGFDTIACHLFGESHHDFKFHLDSEYAVIRSLYNDDRPGRLSSWLRAHSEEFQKSNIDLEVILSGTELFVGSYAGAASVVGNLGGKSSRVSGSSSDYKDCTGDKTMKKPSYIVEQSGDHVPGVHYYGPHYWNTVEGPHLMRLPKGSYLEKPKFINWDDIDLSYDRSKEGVLQLTRFDDFVILGSGGFNCLLLSHKIMNIVQKNASKTADVIAAQLIKSAMKESTPLPLHPITVIVIFLNHKEIMQREPGKGNFFTRRSCKENPEKAHG